MPSKSKNSGVGLLDEPRRGAEERTAGDHRAHAILDLDRLAARIDVAEGRRVPTPGLTERTPRVGDALDLDGRVQAEPIEEHRAARALRGDEGDDVAFGTAARDRVGEDALAAFLLEVATQLVRALFDVAGAGGEGTQRLGDLVGRGGRRRCCSRLDLALERAHHPIRHLGTVGGGLLCEGGDRAVELGDPSVDAGDLLVETGHPLVELVGGGLEALHALRIETTEGLAEDGGSRETEGEGEGDACDDPGPDLTSVGVDDERGDDRSDENDAEECGERQVLRGRLADPPQQLGDTSQRRPTPSGVAGPGDGPTQPTQHPVQARAAAADLISSIGVPLAAGRRRTRRGRRRRSRR